ncbi:hypothetical protein [Haloparvum sp. AD34]
MNVYQFPLSLYAFLAIVAVVPAWMFFLSEYGQDLPTEAWFMASLVLPATVLLFITSWVQPG